VISESDVKRNVVYHTNLLCASAQFLAAGWQIHDYCYIVAMDASHKTTFLDDAGAML